MYLSLARRLAVVLSLFFSPLIASAAGDWGSSHNLLLKAKLNQDWFLISRSNLATRQDFDDTFFGFAGLALGYQFDKKWSVRAGYRRAWFRPGDEWLEEDRPFGEIYYATRVNGFRLTSRSRAELRFFNYRDDDVRFRQELSVEAPWEFTPLKLKIFAEDEIFYSFDNSQYETNWLTGGVSWRPVNGVKLKLGYRWLRQRVGSRFINRNVVVTGMNFFF